MTAWTAERVVALAPDAASAAAGRGLAALSKWSGMGRSARAVWGLCQGSGKTPYQTRVDLSEPAFKCSCPSRKFPCKHGIGLMLLLAKDEKVFAAAEEPGWVSEWLDGRTERAEKKVEKAKAAAEKPVDLEAQAKRAEKREARVMEGVGALRVWLDDLVRRGLAAAQADGTGVFEKTAARMVDCQAPGLAGYVRRIPELLASGAGWEGRTLDHLGRLHLLLCAAERVHEEGFPADLAVDVRTALGWTQAKEEALAGEAVVDRWVVAGQVIEDEERVRVRRSWLIGRGTGTRALVLDFAAGTQGFGGGGFDGGLAAGIEFDGAVAFYPGRQRLRAVIKERGEAGAVTAGFGVAADASVEDGLTGYARALGVNPWLARWPVVVRGARVAVPAGGPGGGAADALVVDADGKALPVRRAFAAGINFWRMVSVSGGRPVDVVLEWDGVEALPLAVVREGVFVDLAMRWAA